MNKVWSSLRHQANKVKEWGKIRLDLPKYLIIYTLTLRRINKTLMCVQTLFHILSQP